MILIFKFLEIFQYSTLSFIISLYLTNISNDILFDIIFNIFYKKNSILNLIIICILYLFLLSIIFYFINKILKNIPFIFNNYSKRFGYISSLKDENIIGTSLGLSFIYFQNHDKLNKLIIELNKKIRFK